MRKLLMKLFNHISRCALWITTFLLLFLGQRAFLKDVLHVPSYQIGLFYWYEIIPLVISVVIMIRYCVIQGPYDHD